MKHANYSKQRRKMQMAYFKLCPRCGAALDPGEKCDCEETEEILNQQSKVHQKNKAMYLDLQEQRELIEV